MPNVATITINNNDTTDAAINPLNDATFFVRQQYLDFLRREPDAPGLNGWLNTLNNCAAGDTSCDRVHVSQMFYQSEEFQQRGYFIYRFYSTSFGRKPDYTEFRLDSSNVSGFLTERSVGGGEACVHCRLHIAGGVCGEIQRAG